MKILQICNRVPYPLVDGGAIAMFAMTKSFADAGCEVHTLAINTNKHFVDSAMLPDWFTSKTKLICVNANTDVTPLGAFLNLFTNASYNLVRFDIPAFHQKLTELLVQNHYDVVQLEGFFLSPYIPTIRANSAALIAMRAHNVEFLIWERMAGSTKFILKKWYLNLLAKRLKQEELNALNLVDCIVPISSVDESTYKVQGAKVPMHVSTAGVEEKLLNLPLKSFDENSLFHLAAMNWQPNLQAAKWLVEKIWPLVSKTEPELQLFLAGKDMPTEFYKLESKNLHVSGSIENAYEFMLGKNIMLVPLLSGSGMRIKIIEGLALGKIIISTRIGAEGIACTHKKDILLAETAEEFANAIVFAIQNKSFCNELSKNARELVKRTYTNTGIVNSLLDFYSSLIRK